MITGGWEEAKENMIAVWDNIAEAAQTIWFGIKNIFITLLQLFPIQSLLFLMD